jgi:hypothetical protein
MNSLEEKLCNFYDALQQKFCFEKNTAATRARVRYFTKAWMKREGISISGGVHILYQVEDDLSVIDTKTGLVVATGINDAGYSFTLDFEDKIKNGKRTGNN